MTSEEVADRFEQTWDGRAELLPARAQHDPEWWGQRVRTKLEQRDGRIRGMVRVRHNYDWGVKFTLRARVMAGEGIRVVAEDLGVPYFTARNWMRAKGGER